MRLEYYVNGENLFIEFISWHSMGVDVGAGGCICVMCNVPSSVFVSKVSHSLILCMPTTSVTTYIRKIHLNSISLHLLTYFRRVSEREREHGKFSLVHVQSSRYTFLCKTSDFEWLLHDCAKHYLLPKHFRMVGAEKRLQKIHSILHSSSDG